MNTDSTADISRGKRRLVVTGVAVAALVLYGCIFIRFMGVYACGFDPTGYFNCAKLLDEGHPKVDQRAVPGVDFAKLDSFTFVPPGLRPIGEKQLGPLYSTGVPLAIVAFSRIAGWRIGPPLVMFVSSFLGVVLTFLLGRTWGLKTGWAGMAALILAANPLYLFLSFVMMSDVPALVCATAAVLVARWSRSRDLWALAAGCAVAAAVLVRATNLLVIFPVAVCLGFSWRRWLWLALGGMPGAVYQLLFNFYTYGHLLESSYGNSVRSDNFSLSFIPATLVQYAHWMPLVMTPLVMLVFGLPWLVRRAPNRALALIAWIIVYFGFYATFIGTHADWQSNRYVLPAFPACLVGALWVLQTMCGLPWAARLRQRVEGLLQKRPHPGVIIAAWVAAIAWLVYDLHDNRHLPNLYAQWYGPWLPHIIVFYKQYMGPVLPVFLLLICGGVMKWLKKDFQKNLPFLGKLVLALIIGKFLTDSDLHSEAAYAGEHQRADVEVCRWAKKNLPPDSVIYTYQMAGALYYYTGFTIVRCETFMHDGEQKEIERACATSAMPIYALMRDADFDYMKERNQYERWAANWTQFEKIEHYTCWRLNKEPAPVESRE